MRNNFALISIIMIIWVIFISGCIGQEKPVTAKGIEINEFSVDPSDRPVESSDVVNFYLDIQNKGGTTARCVKAELYGVENWYDMTGNIVTHPVVWGRQTNLGFSYYDNDNFYICESGLLGNIMNSISSSLKINDNFCYGKSGGQTTFSGLLTGTYSEYNAMWGDFTNTYCQAWESLSNQYGYIKTWDSLEPSDPARNKDGQFATAQWQLRPPSLPQGTITTYPITARVQYYYKSTATANIQAFNKAEYDRKRNLGEGIDDSVDLVNAHDSPIIVTLKKGDGNVIIDQRRPGYELYSYVFEIQNAGDGWPLPVMNDAWQDSGFISGFIRLRGPGAYIKSCAGTTMPASTKDVFLSREVARLRSDGTVPISCTIMIDRSVWADRPLDTLQFIFDLNYVYYTDATVNVQVIGERY